MIAAWTKAHANFVGSTSDTQVTRTSMFDHEDDCLFHVVMSANVIRMKVN